MSGRYEVQLQTPAPVLVAGPVLILTGPALAEAARLFGAGIKVTAGLDGIEARPIQLELLGAAKQAAENARASTTTTTTTTRRRGPVAGASETPRQVLSKEQVADLLRRDPRWVRDHAADLDGWRSAGRGRPWLFDSRRVHDYLEGLSE